MRARRAARVLSGGLGRFEVHNGEDRDDVSLGTIHNMANEMPNVQLNYDGLKGTESGV